VGYGIEDLRIETTAGAVLAPRQIIQGGLTPSVHRGTDGRDAEGSSNPPARREECRDGGAGKSRVTAGQRWNPGSCDPSARGAAAPGQRGTGDGLPACARTAGVPCGPSR